MATSQVKISSFYGDIARPYMVLDKNGEAVKDRVEKPISANAGLLAWAAKAPFEAGGALQKPTAYSKAPPKARHEFAIFCDLERAEIMASNPSLISDFEEKAFKVAASLYWKEKLNDEQRAKYKDMAYLEQKAIKRATETLAEEDPEFAQHLEKEAAYKKAKSALVTAHKMSSGPLWRAEREMNKAHKAAKDISDKDNATKTSAVGKKQQQKKRNTNGARKVKVPEALKMKFVPRPTKRYTVRSKAKLAQIAAEKKAAAALAAISEDKGEYSGEFALPDASHQEQRVTRSRVTVNPAPVVAKKTKAQAKVQPAATATVTARRNRRK